MGVQTISFKREPPRSSSGFPLPEGSGIPVMRGRKKLVLKDMVKKLDTALENLASTVCSFWACEGPSRPRDMCTCRKCYAMRDIAAVRATMVRAIKDGKKGAKDNGV